MSGGLTSRTCGCITCSRERLEEWEASVRRTKAEDHPDSPGAVPDGQRWTIRPFGPDGLVDHFYADGNETRVEVMPVAEHERALEAVRKAAVEVSREMRAAAEEEALHGDHASAETLRHWMATLYVAASSTEGEQE